jgi:hypothetical protein
MVPTYGNGVGGRLIMTDPSGGCMIPESPAQEGAGLLLPVGGAAVCISLGVVTVKAGAIGPIASEAALQGTPVRAPTKERSA